MSEKACRNCRLIVNTNLCPECKTASSSEEWVGEAIILDPKNSLIAKSMGITKPGRYALRVR
ncbi:MAG: DNA-directed polymerase subunit [Thermoproteota archaeon]|nr:DNA-directed polymerase subunit [Thermoproteota archaeon]